MKQEHKVESLNNCTNELQQPTCAQRLELEDVRLQEELVMKEKSASRHSD